MAQEMANGIKRVVSSNLLHVSNSQMVLPSDVYSITSMKDSGERVSLQCLVSYHQNCREYFSHMSRKVKHIEVVTGN